MKYLPFVSLVFFITAIVTLIKFLVRLYRRTQEQQRPGVTVFTVVHMLRDAGIPEYRFIEIPHRGALYDVEVVQSFINQEK